MPGAGTVELPELRRKWPPVEFEIRVRVFCDATKNLFPIRFVFINHLPKSLNLPILRYILIRGTISSIQVRRLS